MQSRHRKVKGYIDRISSDKIMFYYLNYLLFKEYGELANAESCWKLVSYKISDFEGEIVNKRNLGLALKKIDVEKAKKAFTEAAEAGDPISQYELAQMLGSNNSQYEALVEVASSKLIQARAGLYRFYLERKQYQKAYTQLEYVIDSIQKIKLEIIGLPKITSGSLIEIIYENALTSQGQEQLHLYNMAASQYYLKSIIALVDHSKKEKQNSQEESLKIKNMILSSKKGSQSETAKLIDLIKKGDDGALIEVLDAAKIDWKSDYYIKLIEIASLDENPKTACIIGMMYYKAIGVKQDVGKGRDILSRVYPVIETLASTGDLMAQYQIGWIYREVYNKYGDALSWYAKSAVHFLPALHELGNLYRYSVKSMHYSPSPDLERAEICYRKCAELGYTPSQIALGWIALENKDYTQAKNWFEKSMSKGYLGCQHRLKQLYKEGDEAVKYMVLQLAQHLINNQETFSETKEWAKEILKINGDTSIESIVFETADNPSQKTSLLQQNALQGEEEQKIDTDDSEKIKESSHNRQILSLTGILYDNPQAVAEAQISSLMNLAGKNVSTPKAQMGHQNHVKEVSIFNEEMRSSIHVKEPSLAKAPMVSLTQAAFLDEKLMSQAEYFDQTGVAFSTLEDAVRAGTVHMMGELPPTEEESILDAAIDWMGLSHLSEDFSHLL